MYWVIYVEISSDQLGRYSTSQTAFLLSCTTGWSLRDHFRACSPYLIFMNFNNQTRVEDTICVGTWSIPIGVSEPMINIAKVQELHIKYIVFIYDWILDTSKFILLHLFVFASIFIQTLGTDFSFGIATLQPLFYLFLMVSACFILKIND